MGSRRSGWLAAAVAVALPIPAASAIPVASVIALGGLDADLGSLGGCAIRIQYADALGMRIPMPIHRKEIDAVL